MFYSGNRSPPALHRRAVTTGGFVMLPRWLSNHVRLFATMKVARADLDVGIIFGLPFALSAVYTYPRRGICSPIYSFCTSTCINSIGCGVGSCRHRGTLGCMVVLFGFRTSVSSQRHRTKEFGRLCLRPSTKIAHAPFPSAYDRLTRRDM